MGGLITSFFQPKTKQTKQPRGRPRKKNKTTLHESGVVVEKAPIASDCSSQKYTDYKSVEGAAALNEAVNHYIVHGTCLSSSNVEVSDQPIVFIPKSTVREHARKRKSIESAAKPSLPPPQQLNSGAAEVMLKDQSTGYKCLTTPAMRDFLVQTIKF